MKLRPPNLHTLILGFLLYKLGTLAVNLLTFPVLRSAPIPGWPRASILVPARDEAHNLPRTLPTLLAQGAFEVIVLDDGSRDATAKIARDLGARVIEGRPLPAGWLGKPWACHQLAGVARGDVLIFSDADVCWQPGALGAVLGELTRSGADLLSVWPRQEARSPGERLVAPLADDVLLSLLPAPLIRLPFASASAGSGQLMAFWAARYRRAGGHRLVRGEVLEDVRLAAKLKARGARLAVALGGDLAHVRLYRNYPESVAGFAKSLPAAHGDVRALLVLSWVWHLLAYSLPWLLGWRFPRWRRLALLTLLERLLVNFKTGRTSWADLAEVPLTPLTPLATLPVYLRALGKTYSWKGRTYARGKGGQLDP